MLRSICLLVRGGILRYWHLKIWRELDLSGGLAVRFGPPSLIHGLAVARSSVHHTPFSGAFCKCARRSTKYTRRSRAEGPSFLSLRSIFNSWPFIYAFFAGGLCERLFCASSNRLARVCICFDELLRIPSSVLWIVSSIFGRAPSPHLAVSVSDIRRRREGSKK